MSKTLTFIHSADYHLGAPIRGVAHLTQEWRQRLLDALTQSFDRLVDEALRCAVDFVVIAGDVFDQAKPSIHDLTRAVGNFQRLSEASIPVYFCGGNHDPFSQWQKEGFLNAVPSDVFLFESASPSYFLYRRDGEPLCLLGGRSYFSKIWPADSDIGEGITRQAAEEALGEESKSAPFGVGVLHTGLNLDTIKAPTNAQRLLDSGFDYWALGHIHRRWIDDVSNPRLVFSGCLQGRDLKETGRRGASLVTLTEGAPNKIRFIPTASIAFARLTVDVSLCTDLSQVKERIMAALFYENGNSLCEAMISRIELVGKTPLHSSLNKAEFRESLRLKINEAYEDFFCDYIFDRTVSPEVADQISAFETERIAYVNPSKPFDFESQDSSAIDLAAGKELFPSLLMAAAHEQRRDSIAEIAYLQEAMGLQGLEYAALNPQTLERLSQEAERLNLDLINASKGD